MNLILFDDHDIVSPGTVALSDHRREHIRKILKLDAGSKLRIGKINSKIGTAKISECTDQLVKLEILDLDVEPPTASRIDLVLALPRPKSLKRILRAIANLGIKSVHLIHSSKVDKSYWTAPALTSPIMRQALLDGLSIARDTELPLVKLHPLFKPFAQDVAPFLVETEAYVAHPINSPDSIQAARMRSATSNPTDTRIPIAIGPEGGFTDYEVGLLNEAGFKSLSLGDRLYSVETAVPVIESLFRFH